MSKLLFKYFILFTIGATIHSNIHAQSNFLQSQKSSFRVSNAFANKEASLAKEFSDKKLTWPANYIYIRSFKFDSQLEVWVKNNLRDKYELFKTYRVCMQSGTMGPKRLQGDFQIPEGFYYINEFNPRSAYHLSLGLNYPNSSDRILSDSLRPGNGIYIHGNCVSIGCVAVNDSDVEELYVLSAYARAAGQEYIPVHIFPVKYSSERSLDYLNTIVKNNPGLKGFFGQLKTSFDQFEKTKQLPVVLVDENGNYLFN